MRTSAWILVAAVLGSTLCGGVWLSLTSAMLMAAENSPEAAAQGHFESTIAPLLSRHCVDCHDAAAQKGGLDLSTREAAFAGGDSGAAIVAGKASESLLWQHVAADEMPKGRAPLSVEEKRLLREWIDAGAAWSGTIASPEQRRGVSSSGVEGVRRLTVTEYIETVRSAVGVDIEADARQILPRDLRADGFTNTAYNLNVDLQHVEGYAQLAQRIVEQMDVVMFAAEFAPKSVANRMRQTSEPLTFSHAEQRSLISGMGRWLLRGPLNEQEIQAFVGVAEAVSTEGGDAVESLRFVVEAMLQSPRFVYRIEPHRDDSEQVDAYVLASRMSYIVWGAPPDRELMRAAEAGELGDRGSVAAQLQRMLEDPRAIERSTQFAREWLNLDRLEYLRPDAERFPTWDPQLATDMRNETLAFFREVAWEQNRPLGELLNAQLTFATPRLAAHYGLDGRPSEPSSIAVPAVVQVETPSYERVRNGLQVLYTFTEGAGDTVRDSADAGEPLHLEIADSAAVRWSDAGLTIQSSTLIAADQPPARLIDAVRRSQSITLEAWITPANTTQAGPARILTLSNSISARNFTLGQDANRYEVRFRHKRTDANGHPAVSSPAGSLATRTSHVVYTREASGTTRLYIDGDEVARMDSSSPSDLSNWESGFKLALANEHSRDRTWLGTLHLAAIYDRALTQDEVRQNRAAGPRPTGRTATTAADNQQLVSSRRRPLSRKDLQALYLFDEVDGDLVHDSSGAGDPIHLLIDAPKNIRWHSAGLTVTTATLISSSSPAGRLVEAIRASGETTIEAWVTPATVAQTGPARVVSLSSGPSLRNFTLGQDGDKYDVRFRTTATSENGIPSLASPVGTAEVRPTRVVYTRNSDGRTALYVDGMEIAQSQPAAGDLTHWDEGFRLAMANETSGDRPWLGTFHLVAIYSRALTPDEIRWQGAGLARYDLTENPDRGGLLTQGSLLTIGGDDASMVTRGLFILTDFLHGAVDDPPACVDTTPVPAEPGMSRRAVAMQRITNAACAGCHSRFEPPAFGLEKFDGIGASHERDEYGNLLREDGEILFPGDDQTVRFNSVAELMDLLAGSDRVQLGITRKLTQYALGRPLVDADEPVIAKIHREAQDHGGTYRALITAIILSDLVQKTGRDIDG